MRAAARETRMPDDLRPVPPEESAAGGGAPRRRRFLPLVWLAALLILAAGVEGAISGFTASINNTTNTAGSARC